MAIERCEKCGARWRTGHGVSEGNGLMGIELERCPACKAVCFAWWYDAQRKSIVSSHTNLAKYTKIVEREKRTLPQGWISAELFEAARDRVKTPFEDAA